ncbi:MAG: hypothetical protein GXN92_01230 [Candidatus Micrarchaeota archaeon]|nr:hypothetical protein [Candidatus Micrarchaeota archaeon]
MRGYVFTLAAFVLLLVSFYLVIIKSENVKLLDETYGTLTKTHTMLEFANLLNEKNLQSYLNTSTKYALIVLTFHAAENQGLKEDVNFSKVLMELLNNGSVSGDYFVGGNELSLPDQRFSLKDLTARINERAKQSGFQYEVRLKDLKAEMKDFTLLQLEYSIEVLVYDIANTTGKNVTYENQILEINITGLPEPLAARLISDYGINTPYYLPIQLGEKPEFTFTFGEQGNGWVYGRVYTDIEDVPNNHDEPNILMGSFDYVKNYINDEKIDGFIIVEPEGVKKVQVCQNTVNYNATLHFNETNTFNDRRWREDPYECINYDEVTDTCLEWSYKCVEAGPLYHTDKAWILVKSTEGGLGVNELNQTTTLILTDNPFGSKEYKDNQPIKLVNVEGWRTLINCGKGLPFAAKGNDGEYVAPDYIGRFYSNFKERGSQYGYIVFLIEDEFYSDESDTRSSIAFEKLGGIAGDPIRGLAGCKAPRSLVGDAPYNCLGKGVLRISETLLGADDGTGLCPISELGELMWPQ